MTAENPNESLLAELRLLEKKLGLVLTLVSYIVLNVTSNADYQFKSSVYKVMQDHDAAQEEAQQAELARQEREEMERDRQERSYQRSYQERWDDSMEE